MNLRFPGQYADTETGGVYNWHRYYDPPTGRYLQVEPLAHPHRGAAALQGPQPQHRLGAEQQVTLDAHQTSGGERALHLRQGGPGGPVPEPPGPGPHHLLLHLEVGGAAQLQEDMALAGPHREAGGRLPGWLRLAAPALPQPGQGPGQPFRGDGLEDAGLP